MADLFGKIANVTTGIQAAADILGLGGDSKKTKRAIQQTPDTVITSSRADKTFGDVNYPSDLGNIFFGLGFKEYTYAPSTGQADPQSGTVWKCNLPLPKELNQEYNVDWAADQIGPYTKPLLDVAVDQIRGKDEGIISQMLDDPELAATVGVEAGKAAGKAVASKIAGASGIKSAISLGAGFAENPNDRALLKGIPLRQHRFSWRLAPRNQGEYNDLVAICSKIRSYMLPERTTSQTLLKFPYVADVKIYTDTANLTYFKTAAVQSFQYNLAPEAAPVMLNGAEFKPAVVELQLQMIELEALSRKDFT